MTMRSGDGRFLPAGPMRDRLIDGSVPEPNSGCWLWLRALRDNGYATIKTGGKSELAHRVSYRTFRGQIPEGLDIDHLCRTRACINPEHLDPVIPVVNWWRGDAPSAKAAKRHHCIRGHLYTPENTAIDPRRGRRVCKTCRLNAGRAYEASGKRR